jgi:hypothetical protein
VLLASSILTACASPVGRPAAGGTPSGPPSQGQGTTTYQGVSFTGGTVVMDAGAVRSGLRSQSGASYHFASGTPGLSALRPGRVVVMPGTAVRRVVAVTTQGGETVVETSDAKLDEAIQTGTLGWSRPVNWNQVPRSSFVTAAFESGLHPALFSFASGASSSIKFSGEVQGFEVEFSLTPQPDGSLEFDMSAGRSNIRVQASGTISQFVSEARLVYDKGTAQLFDATERGLRGDVKLERHAIGVGSAFDNDTPNFKLPFSVPIPIDVGPIPMVLTIKSGIRFAPVLRQQSSSGGSFKVSYDSDFGFRFDAAKSTPESTVRAESAELGDQPTVTAGFLPVGFGWGWEFPRAELGLAGTGTFAALSMDTYMAGEFTPGTILPVNGKRIQPCQRAQITMHAIAIWNVGVLGFTIASSQKTLWEKVQMFYKDNKPCDLTTAT